jgi:hypothetical protein
MRAARLPVFSTAVAAVIAVVVSIGVGACGSDNSSPAKLAGHRVQTGTFGSAPQEQAVVPGAEYNATGRLVADDGFRPDTDGFSFPNYGGNSGATDLTPAGMAALFGPQVCASGTGSSCLLTPPAQEAMDQMNHATAGGHCYGFSVAALRFFKHVMEPTIFGASTVPSLNIQGNDSLQLEIAEAFVSQMFPSVQNSELTGSPNAILNELIRSLRANQDLYTIGITKTLAHNRSKEQVGHAITPYAVEDRGGGRFAVLIYDNNHPLKERAVLFNRNTNTWGYDAAQNPNDPTWHFQGTAKSPNMVIDSLSAGLGPQRCFFCAGANAYQQIALEGDPSNHSHLVITDPQGRRTGYVRGKLVTEIPGSKAITPLTDQNWRISPEPVYQVPVGVQLTVSIDGASLARPTVENVSLVAPGASAVVEGVKVAPLQKAQVRFGPVASSVRYSSGSVAGAAPVVKLGREVGGADYAASVKAPVLKRGSTLKVGLNLSTKQLSVETPAGAPKTGYVLALARLAKLGKQEFKPRGVSLTPGGRALLKFRAFKRTGQTLPLSVRQGASSTTTRLSG